jgi:hypothetical protein
MSLAGFNFEALNQQWWVADNKPVNTASRYGVTVVPIAVDGYAWRCIGAYHLSPDENRGRHNVFVDVLGKDGKRVRNAQIKWRWADNAPIQTRWLDKPDNEPACDIPIDKGATITLWVDNGALASEVVTGIHARHTDEGMGNTYGHHSYYVVFAQLRNAIVIPPIDPPTVPDDVATLQAEIARLRSVIASAQKALGAA